MSAASVRQRNLTSDSTSKTTPLNSQPVQDEAVDTSPVISVLDIIRIIFTLCAASCALSYYLTSGESVLWGYRPWLTRPQLLKSYFNGPVNLTPSQLSKYDGSNPDLPIYLAINGTIFDVSAGRHTYGPGGSYSIFAGRDATRAFVTGCFLEDTTDDLRGAELIYIPLDDNDDDLLSSAERKTRSERERRLAKKKVREEVQKWEDFYKNSQKYFEVGKVIRQDKYDGPPPVLCDSAMKSRPKRSKTKKGIASAEGKPV